MTPADLDALERLARAATPGPWVSDGCDIKSPNEALWIYDEGGHSEGDARYIAAMNPETTLALIARVRELEGALRRIERASSCGDPYTEIGRMARAALTSKGQDDGR